jgi:hypothetical protein
MKLGLALLVAGLLGTANATETRIGPTTIELVEGQALETLSLFYVDGDPDRPVTVTIGGAVLNPRLMQSVLIGPARINLPEGRLISYRVFTGTNLIAFSFPAFAVGQAAAFSVPEGKKAVMFKNSTLGMGADCGLLVEKEGRTYGRLGELVGNEEFAGPCTLKFQTGVHGGQDWAFYWSFALADNREPLPIANLPLEPGLHNLLVETSNDLETWSPIGALPLALSKTGFFRLRIAPAAVRP